MTRATILLMLFTSTALGQSPDPIKAKLDKARAEYKATDEALKAELISKFAIAEVKAEKDGKIKEVDLVEAERRAMVGGEQWEFRSIDAQLQKQKRDAAWKAMRDAYAEAVNKYVQSKRRPEARVVQEELDGFDRLETESLGKLANKAFDSLQPGTVWSGKRHAENNNGTVPFELLITERRGNSFKGTTTGTGNANNKHAIDGLIHDGKVEWFISKVLVGPNPGQDHTGTIKDDTLLLRFKGEWNGGKIYGHTELKLQK